MPHQVFNTQTNRRLVTPKAESIGLQAPSSHSARLPVKTSGWLRQLILRLSVGSKINGGYAIALGIAVLGTTVGFTIGNHLESQARKNAEKGHEEGVLLSELQTAVLQARSHQQQFIPLLGQPQGYQEEHSHFLRHIERVKTLMSDAEANKNNTNIEKVKTFTETYNGTVEIYFQEIEKLLQKIDPLNLKPEEILEAQQLLLKFSNSEAALKLDSLSDNLTELSQLAFDVEKKAEAEVEQAVNLRTAVVTVSMLLSVAMAATLALLISREITHPITAVTNIAQRVTEEENFDLQAPVITEDEVGVLAVSLNHLIERVKCLLEEQKAEQQAQLIQSEKMSSLGRMLAGVAHEINNPVNFVYGNLMHAGEYVEELIEMLETYSAEFPNPPQAVVDQAEEIELEFLKQDLPKLLQSMKVGAERVRQIVLSLKNFSRLDEAEVHPVDLNACLDSTLLILNNRIKKGITVNRNYGQIEAIEGFSGLLYQVFMNLLSNALDAIDERPESSDQELTITTQYLDKDWITVKIFDTGLGITPENQAKIFETFFTTKPRGVGTGLGLAITYQIVTEKHGGKITFESQRGEGTEFTITLPIKHLHTTSSPVPLLSQSSHA